MIENKVGTVKSVNITQMHANCPGCPSEGLAEYPVLYFSPANSSPWKNETLRWHGLYRAAGSNYPFH